MATPGAAPPLFLFVYSESAEKHSGGGLNLTRERFVLNLALASRVDLEFREARAIPSNVSSALANVQAVTVLHISSHGNTDGLRFEESYGSTSHMATKEELRVYVEQCRPRPELLVLSACNSLELGRFACTLHVPHVIATNCAVPDDVACNFMARFYSCLADPSGRVTVQEAFRLACENVNNYPSFVLLPDGGLSSHDVSLFRPLQASARLCPTNLPARPQHSVPEVMIDPLEKIWMTFQSEGFRYRTVVVAGEAHGVGSSFVALHAAHHLRERSCFPGGIVWVPPSEESLLQRVGSAIGLTAAVLAASGDDALPVLERLRACTRRLLIVLDNVEPCSCFLRTLRGGDSDNSADDGPSASTPSSCCSTCTTLALSRLLGTSSLVHALVATTDDASQTQPSDLNPAFAAAAAPGACSTAFGALSLDSSSTVAYGGVVVSEPPKAEVTSPYDAVTPAVASSPVLLPPAPPAVVMARSVSSLTVYPGIEPGSESGTAGPLFFAGGARPRVVRVTRRRYDPRYAGKDDSDSLWTAMRLLFERRLRLPPSVLKGEIAWLVLLASAARVTDPRAERPTHSLLEHFDEPRMPRESLVFVLGDACAELEAVRKSPLRSDPAPTVPRGRLQGLADSALLQDFEATFVARDLKGCMRAIDAFVQASALRRFYALPMNTASSCERSSAMAQCTFRALPLDAAALLTAFNIPLCVGAVVSPPAAPPTPTPPARVPSDAGAAIDMYAPVATSSEPLALQLRREGSDPSPVAKPSPHISLSTLYAPPPDPALPQSRLSADDVVAYSATRSDAEACLAPYISLGRSGMFVLRGSTQGPGAIAVSFTYPAEPSSNLRAQPPSVVLKHAIVLPMQGGGVCISPNPDRLPNLSAVVETYDYLQQAVIPSTGQVVPRTEVLRLLRAHNVYGKR